MKSAKSWYYQYPRSVYANGPARYKEKMTEREFRSHVRDLDKVKRLPRGFECWTTND